MDDLLDDWFLIKLWGTGSQKEHAQHCTHLPGDAVHPTNAPHAPQYRLSICLVVVTETKLWEPTLHIRVSVKKDM